MSSWSSSEAAIVADDAAEVVQVQGLPSGGSEEQARAYTLHGRFGRSAAKRLTKELEDLIQRPQQNIKYALPVDQDLSHWQAAILGPQDSPYAGDCFELDIYFPEKYPFQSPRVTFASPIYHAEITETGIVHARRDTWSDPRISVRQMLDSIILMLKEPDLNNLARNPWHGQYHQIVDQEMARIRLAAKQAKKEEDR